MALGITPYFAELIGAFVGDGWISKGNSGLTLCITGNPKDEKEYYERIKLLFRKVFSIEVSPRDFKYWKTFGVLVCVKKAINKFIEVGMPVGKKSLTVEVPSQIEKNPKLFPHFIRGVI